MNSLVLLRFLRCIFVFAKFILSTGIYVLLGILAYSFSSNDLPNSYSKRTHDQCYTPSTLSNKTRKMLSFNKKLKISPISNLS